MGEVMVLAMAMEVIMARERLRLKPDIMDTVDMSVMDMDMDTEAMDIMVIMARERPKLRPRLRLVTMDTMDTVDIVMDMAIMAREKPRLRLVTMDTMDTVDMVMDMVTEAMDIMDIMVTEAMDMVIMDKSKVSFIQTVLSSESELRMI